jgi:hypothetical protein
VPLAACALDRGDGDDLLWSLITGPHVVFVVVVVVRGRHEREGQEFRQKMEREKLAFEQSMRAQGAACHKQPARVAELS